MVRSTTQRRAVDRYDEAGTIESDRSRLTKGCFRYDRRAAVGRQGRNVAGIGEAALAAGVRHIAAIRDSDFRLLSWTRRSALT